MNQVTHLLRWFLPFTASFIRNQIAYHERYSPSIVYLQKEEGAFQQELEAGAEVFYPLGAAMDRVLYEKARFLTPAAKREIKGFLKRQAPDILHVHYGVDAIVYADIIREMGIPACVSFYGYDCTSFPKRFNGYGKKLLQQKVFRNPGIKAVLAMTEDMKADLLALGCPEEKIIVHYYGTETSPFYQDTARHSDDTVNLLIISGLHEKKGHRYLIEAFEKAGAMTRQPMHLHIVGDGPLRQDIERQTAESNPDRITLHGPVQYRSEEHLSHFQRAHIFAHPSVTPPNGDKEGIPGGIIEAMAAGLPVISTYHAGIPHILEDLETGLLVEERDVTALAEAIAKLAQNKELRQKVARNGQQKALASLGVEEKEKELEAIYDALKAGRPWQDPKVGKTVRIH